MKPPKHPIRTILVLMAAEVFFGLSVGALNGFRNPDPRWLAPVSIVLFTTAFTWACGGFPAIRRRPER
jgi:hypothetical protein